jgi:hypothetical protein
MNEVLNLQIEDRIMCCVINDTVTLKLAISVDWRNSVMIRSIKPKTAGRNRCFGNTVSLISGEIYWG